MSEDKTSEFPSYEQFKEDLTAKLCKSGLVSLKDIQIVCIYCKECPEDCPSTLDDIVCGECKKICSVCLKYSDTPPDGKPESTSLIICEKCGLHHFCSEECKNRQKEVHKTICENSDEIKREHVYMEIFGFLNPSSQK